MKNIKKKKIQRKYFWTHIYIFLFDSFFNLCIKTPFCGDPLDNFASGRYSAQDLKAWGVLEWEAMKIEWEDLITWFSLRVFFADEDWVRRSEYLIFIVRLVLGFYIISLIWKLIFDFCSQSEQGIFFIRVFIFTQKI